MGTVVVVDGGDVCRAPIVAFTLRQQLTEAAALASAEVVSRGLAATDGATMCEAAASRLGWSGPAIAFYGAHRATALTEDDLADADLVLTAERQQRSAAVRMQPGSQARVFTWKEALVLASVLTDRVAAGTVAAPQDLPGLARALHACRGAVPLIEPPVRTGMLHLRRGRETDPLTVPDAHGGEGLHAHVTEESQRVALVLSARVTDLVAGRIAAPAALPTRWRRHA